MGKLTSYILGLSTAVILSYIVLSAEYMPLINWLGPTMGSDVIFPFSFLFLLLGSAIAYPMLLGSWIAIGIVVGLGARKGTRAIGAAVSVYLSIWGLLALSSLAVFEKFTGFSPGSTAVTQISTSFPVPPLPPGVTISAILSEPLFQPLISLVSNFPGTSGLFTAATGTSSPTSLIGSFLSVFETTFLPSLIINIVVFMVVSGLVGFVMFRLLNRKQAPGQPGEIEPKKAKIKKVKVKKVVKKTLHSGVVVATIVPVLVALLFLATPAASILQGVQPSTTAPHSAFQAGVSAQKAAVNSVLSEEPLIFHNTKLMNDANASLLNSTSLEVNYGGGYLGKYGNIYNLYAFLNASRSSGNGMFNQFAGSSSILSAVFITANTESVFSSLAQDGIINSSIVSTLQSNHFYNLIPQATIIELSLGNVSSVSSAVHSEASGLSASIGGGSPVQYLGINLPLGNTTGTNEPLSLFAYDVNITLSNTESKLVQNYGSKYFSGGSYPVFNSGITNGSLVPGYSSQSTNASMFVAGQFSPSKLPSSLSGYSNVLNVSNPQSDVVSFMGGLFLREHVVHSSATTHRITAAQMFGYTGNITFTGNYTAYALSLMYPQSSSNSAFSGYSMQLYSNFGNFSAIGSSSSFTFNSVPSGSQLNLSSLNFTTNATFPAAIKVSETVNHWTGNIYNVSIVLTNNDTDTLSNVSLNAVPILGVYGNSSKIIQGSTNAFLPSLKTGQSISVNYQVSLSGVGTYYLAEPYFNYSMNGSAFNIPGNVLTAYAQPPSVVHAVNQVELVSFSALASYVKLPILVSQVYPGIYFFDLIFLLVVVLDVLLEVRAFKKWRSARNPQ